MKPTDIGRVVTYVNPLGEEVPVKVKSYENGNRNVAWVLFDEDWDEAAGLCVKQETLKL